MSNNNILAYDAPSVVGIPDSDLAGHIPPDLLLNGIEVLIKVWPQQSPDGKQDTLIVRLLQNGSEIFESTTTYTTPITVPEIIIPIGPSYLSNDGVVELSYQTRNFVDNPHPSLPRTLTINHTPVPSDLTEPDFPAATLWGYLNCASIPSIWLGIEVKIPPLPTFCQIGDRCEVEWNGYLSLNASGPAIPGTYKKIIKPILSQQEITGGFAVTVAPYIPHIEPMKINASALVKYSLYRGAKLLGSSSDGLVKIDRTVPGSPVPCGP